MNQVSFRATFLDWRDSVWLPERLLIAKEILTDKENAGTFKDFKERIDAGGMVPFVGAGLSIPSGGVRWSEFLHQLRAHCIPPISAAELDDVLFKKGYEAAAELIITQTVPLLFNTKFELYCHYAEPQKIRGAVRFLPMLFSGHSLTTNFDNVDETIYALSEMPFGQILKGSEVTQWQTYAMRNMTMLLKIHGHGSEPDTRVLTESEYNRAYAVGCQHRLAMEDIMRSSSFIFLGCSLGADRTMELMKGVYSGPNPPDTRNYAILPMPNDEAERRNREAFLAERAIFPIWYGGYGETGDPAFDHDLCVEALLVNVLNEQGRIDTLTVEPEKPLRGGRK